jgi:phosphoserine phosphatase RsbU/P
MVNARPERELYDTAPCGLVLAGADGRLVRVNDTICRWLSQPAEELLRLRFQDLLTMGGRIFYQTHLAPLLRMQGSVAEVKLELRTGAGKAIPVMMNLAEQFRDEQLMLHVAVFMAEDRDKYERELVLQRRRAEELAGQYAQAQAELAQARGQAEDRAQFAEQMMGIVSHDLRNPLSVIQMSAALLGMGELSHQQRNVVARLDRSGKRAERLINDLLGFTQARLGGGISVERQPMDLHAVVREAVAELSAAFPESSIVHDASGAGEISGDRHRLVQALGNLVANAVHHGTAGRPISVSTRGEPQGFTISVHNEGPAIPAEIQDTLFAPMVRGAAARSGGVGLGLFIVREIAKAHEGTVTVQSSPEAGTTFSMELPPPA